ncbi:hypothetical protein HDU76_005825, partial [Blyttiomyces sp. JEL0837]
MTINQPIPEPHQTDFTISLSQLQQQQNPSNQRSGPCLRRNSQTAEIPLNLVKLPLATLRRILSCPVCDLLIFQPVTLPCGNTICSPCLKQERDIDPNLIDPSSEAGCLLESNSNSQHGGLESVGIGAQQSSSTWAETTKTSSTLIDQSHQYQQKQHQRFPNPVNSSTASSSPSKILSRAGSSELQAAECWKEVDMSDCGVYNPLLYRCPVPSCRARGSCHRRRCDMVDVLVQRIIEAAFPKEMEAYRLICEGFERLEGIVGGYGDVGVLPRPMDCEPSAASLVSPVNRGKCCEGCRCVTCLESSNGRTQVRLASNDLQADEVLEQFFVKAVQVVPGFVAAKLCLARALVKLDRLFEAANVTREALNSGESS